MPFATTIYRVLIKAKALIKVDVTIKSKPKSFKKAFKKATTFKKASAETTSLTATLSVPVIASSGNEAGLTNSASTLECLADLAFSVNERLDTTDMGFTPAGYDSVVIEVHSVPSSPATSVVDLAIEEEQEQEEFDSDEETVYDFVEEEEDDESDEYDALMTRFNGMDTKEEQAMFNANQLALGKSRSLPPGPWPVITVIPVEDDEEDEDELIDVIEEEEDDDDELIDVVEEDSDEEEDAERTARCAVLPDPFEDFTFKSTALKITLAARFDAKKESAWRLEQLARRHPASRKTEWRTRPSILGHCGQRSGLRNSWTSGTVVEEAPVKKVEAKKVEVETSEVTCPPFSWVEGW